MTDGGYSSVLPDDGAYEKAAGATGSRRGAPAPVPLTCPRTPIGVRARHLAGSRPPGRPGEPHATRSAVLPSGESPSTARHGNRTCPRFGTRAAMVVEVPTGTTRHAIAAATRVRQRSFPMGRIMTAYSGESAKGFCSPIFR